MNVFKNLILIVLGLALLLSSCVKEDVLENESIIPQGPPQPILETTLHGQIIDEDDQPVQNAEVVFKSGTSEISVQTDEYGMFLFEDVMNKGRSAYLTVSSTGKFDAFRRYGVFADRYNYTVIKMNEKNIDGQVEASQGGTVTNLNGAKVSLPAGGIIDANGNSYEGTVNVAMAWINPDADDLVQRMVGDLSGIDDEGRNQALMTYGMLQVELLDNAGNELNLSSEHEAELSFPIPQTMIGNAKPQIPLWIYDEEIGTWMYEGVALLENGAYVGKVPHFSSFNVDFRTDPIEIVGQVKIESEINSVADTTDGSYLQVYVCSERIGRKGGYLCDDGSFRFYNFPKDEEFTLKILDECGDAIFEETYGPFGESKDLGCILVAPSSSMVSVTGNAVDCDDNPIKEGIFTLNLDNRVLQFPVADDGSISFVVDLCSQTEGEFKVIDTDQLIESDVVSIDLSSPSVDLGDIKLCNQLTEYIQFDISDGTNHILSPEVTYNQTIDSPDSTFASITYYVFEGNTLNIDLNPDNLPTGPATNVTIPANSFTYYGVDPNGVDFYYYSFDPSAISIVFDEFDPNQGGKMKGSFSGEVIDERGQGQTLTITGTFDFTVK